MSKGNSYLFKGTKGEINSLYFKNFNSTLLVLVINWAKTKLSELTGKDKKLFNTACIAYDEYKNIFYFGRNSGYRTKGYKKTQFFLEIHHMKAFCLKKL